MRDAQEFQISVEYQIYCLFLLILVSFEVQTLFRCFRQIQLDDSKVDGKVSSCEVKITV